MSGQSPMIGPGLASKDLSPVVRETARRLWQESPLAVVVDASGLQWLPAGPCHANALRVITPHPGEMARLLNCSTKDVQADRAKADEHLTTAATMFRAMDMSVWLAQAEAELAPLA